MDQKIAELLKSFNKRSNEFFLKWLKEKGTTIPQMMTLKEIYDAPKTIGQIVEVLQLSYSTVSGIIDRLERDGWLERVHDERDRRIIWIRKTEKLDEKTRHGMLVQEKFYAELLTGLSDQEKEMVVTAVEILYRQLERRLEESHEA